MNVKTNTKEKFSVITPLGPEITANMTEDLEKLLLKHLKEDPPHVVLNMEEVQHIDESAAKELVRIKKRFYHSNYSFVICGIQNAVKETLENNNFLELLNITPTESEAWDIVQMEEIERELFRDDD